MRSLEFEEFSPTKIPPKRRRASKTSPFLAGFFGAIPFGFAFGFPILMAVSNHFGTDDLDVENLLRVLLGGLPLIPVVIASAWIEPPEWPRVLGIIFIGLCVGASLTLLFLLAFLFVFPTAVLGLAFGLTALVTSWRDAADRTLGWLGLAPTLSFFVIMESEALFRPSQPGSLLDALLTDQQVFAILAVLLFLTHALVIAWAVQRAWSRAIPAKSSDWLS